MKRKCMRIFSIWMVLCLFLSGFASVPCKAAVVDRPIALSQTEDEEEGDISDDVVKEPSSIVFKVDGETPTFVEATDLPGREIVAGRTLQLFPYIQYSDDSYDNTNIVFTYASSDESVATVDGTGMVTSKNITADDTTDITVTYSWTDEEGNSCTIDTTVCITVKAVEIESVKLEKTEKTLKIKESYTINAKVLPAEASQELLYKSSDETVVAVSTEGVVTALKEGVATISITPAGNADMTVTLQITVIDVPVMLELSDATKSIMATETYQITANLVYLSGKKVPVTGELLENLIFESANKKVATVSDTGIVTALEQTKYPQTVGIIVTYTFSYLYDGENKEEKVSSVCLITVTEIPVASIALLNPETSITVEIADTYTLLPVITPANASNQTVKFKSSESSVASVDKQGVITAKDIGTAVITAYAADDSSISATFTITVYQTYFDVTKLGADGTDTDSDVTPIRKALKAASKVNEPIHVYIPGGTYYLTTSLIMYSNTTLELAPDATIVRKSSAGDSPMLRSNIDSSIGGYGQIQNVVISGGVWDGNANGKNNFNNMYFGHGQNITIQNTTIKNNSGAHLIEMAGINNAVIDNVTLTGFKVCTKKGYNTSQTVKEAIQLDYCSKSSASSMKPHDNTPSQNITIQNCRISDYMCGIGAHGYKSGVYLNNITIQNNKFTNITNACIDARNFRNMNITKNTVSGYTTFLYSYNSAGKVTSNTIKNKTFTKIKTSGLLSANGMTLSGKSNFTVSKNKIYNAKSNGICVWGGSTATIKSNTIKNSGLYGIRTNASTIKLSKNKFSKNKEGLYDTYSTAKVKSSDDIRAYYVELEETYDYTGKAIKPKIKIKGLKKNKHYKVSYKNNKKVGTATVIIKGKGKYKGTLKLTFEIVKKKK